MDTLRFLVWTVACVAVGIALATVEVLGGRTPVQLAQQLWQQRTATASPAREPAGPTERHQASERRAVDEIIARRQRERNASP